MTESEIQAKLRQVTSPSDPHRAYQRIKKVGQGASGSVYVAKIIETGEKVAIKIMDLAAQPRKELIINEILVMKESRHDNIVNFRDSYLVKSTELWVVMDYMEGGALTDVIDNHTLEEDQISAICQEVRLRSLLLSQCRISTDVSQTCAGLQHLHAKSIIHRDIKSDKYVSVFQRPNGGVVPSDSHSVLLDAQGHVKISAFLGSLVFPKTLC